MSASAFSTSRGFYKVEIRIEDRGNGELGIVSDCDGPFGTIAVLRRAIAVIEKAAAEAEVRASMHAEAGK